jgi:hypothetical protein
VELTLPGFERSPAVFVARRLYPFFKCVRFAQKVICEGVSDANDRIPVLL